MSGLAAIPLPGLAQADAGFSGGRRLGGNMESRNPFDNVQIESCETIIERWRKPAGCS